MKPLKKICILIFIVALLVAYLPITALAGVIGDDPFYGSSAANVSSSLTNLTSTNPSQTFAWSSVPNAPYTATLSADTGYILPSSILVQRVKYYDSATQELIVPATVEQTYTSGSNYTYNATTGEIVIPAATLGDIVYDQSPFNIIITAFGEAETATYTISVTQSPHGTISPGTADNISHGANFTFTITPDSGYRIEDVLADGNSAGAVSTYTFTNIVSNHTITVLFEESSKVQPPSSTKPTSSGTIDDIPKTGESNNSWIWWVMCAISASGITVLTILRKKGNLNR